MRSVIMTNEYPPNVYGGAGVHVDYLSRNLANLIDVEVRCFGEARDCDMELVAYEKQEFSGGPEMKVVSAMGVNLRMIENLEGDIVHCHTWYTFFAGFLAKKLFLKPLVTTIHSLEPLRPWKSEQIGKGGYEISSWMERLGIEASDKVIAVSQNMRDDILNNYNVSPEDVVVIHNGIDTEEFVKTKEKNALKRYNIEGPYILFVGRMTKQKGITDLVEASRNINSKVVICAGASDTPEMEKEITKECQSLDNVILIKEMLKKRDLIELYSNAEIFVCPSVYEPFGIINLEAMACEIPVVATRVGGIVEVVEDNKTGILVEPSAPFKLAKAVNDLLDSDEKKKTFGLNGRKRVEKEFSWRKISQKTADLYKQILKNSRN